MYKRQRVLCVEVNAVARDLAVFAGPVVPVEALPVAVVIVVVGVIGCLLYTSDVYKRQGRSCTVSSRSSVI